MAGAVIVFGSVLRNAAAASTASADVRFGFSVCRCSGGFVGKKVMAPPLNPSPVYASIRSLQTVATDMPSSSGMTPFSILMRYGGESSERTTELAIPSLLLEDGLGRLESHDDATISCADKTQKNDDKKNKKPKPTKKEMKEKKERKKQEKSSKYSQDEDD